MGETPFSPPIERHSDLLSQAPSAELRAIVAGQLQRTYGNQYVQRLVNAMAARTWVSPQKQAPENASIRPITLSSLAESLEQERHRHFEKIIAQGPIRFRIPTTAELKTLFTSGIVPGEVVKNSIKTAVERMRKDPDVNKRPNFSTAKIINRIFPSPGTFDELEYRKIFDMTDQEQIYQNILDAQTKIAGADKPKLLTTITRAKSLVQLVAGDEGRLKLVFGKKYSVAKRVYKKAEAALDTAMTNIDANLSTDYNLDDPEVGVGGWANYKSQHIHLTPAVAKVKNENEAKTTIIHEACHLADSSVVDLGYYPEAPGAWEALPEKTKVRNAAHYEELPRRELGTSIFAKNDKFEPGKTKSGAAPSFEDEVKFQANEYFRKAWDKAVDVFSFLREIRVELLAGNKKRFKAKKALIMKISKMMHLTVHQQIPPATTINQVDIILAEGVARGVGIIWSNVSTQTLPPKSTQPKNRAKAFCVKKIIEQCIKSYPNLTGKYEDDNKLIKWLSKNYQKRL